MSYWLVKSEPDVFSIDELQHRKKTGWDGVRNYQARNYMRDGMRSGDLVLVYHSNADPSGVAGIARVCREAHPDPSQFDAGSPHHDPRATKENPVWVQVELEFVEKFPDLLPLGKLRAETALRGMPLLQKGTRLSVMPVKPAEWKKILQLAKG